MIRNHTETDRLSVLDTYKQIYLAHQGRRCQM